MAQNTRARRVRLTRWISLCVLASLLGVTSLASAQSRPARLQPTRIYSIGDSITRAFDSNFLGDNSPESWVNGYHGPLQSSAGYVDVNSHNQRIAAAFGVDANYNGGRSGERMSDMKLQAYAATTVSPTYVTVELGGNDVCRDSLADVPDPLTFAYQFIDGVFQLDPGIFGITGGLPSGATVYTAAIPDVKQLYDVGKDQSGLFGFDCEHIWTLTILGFPCGSMLSPFNSESDRLALQQVNATYNIWLAALSEALDGLSTDVYWDFTWTPFVLQFAGSDISASDCFHPSSAGQARLSEVTWVDGPFSAF